MVNFEGQTIFFAGQGQAISKEKPKEKKRLEMFLYGKTLRSVRRDLATERAGNQKMLKGQQ